MVKAEITDDTQMTLFTAEGLLRAESRWRGKGICHPPSVVEAIAIAIYCALRYRDDFRKALCAAVNHDGDSDSTGAITGNILGAYLGIKGIPAEWVEKKEMADMLMQIAGDLLIGFKDSEEWWMKYPGW